MLENEDFLFGFLCTGAFFCSLFHVTVSRQNVSSLLLLGTQRRRYQTFDHFQARILIAAFLVKGLLVRAAVENRLVAASIFSDGIQSVYEQTTQAFALSVFGYTNLFNVADGVTIVNTFF